MQIAIFETFRGNSRPVATLNLGPINLRHVLTRPYLCNVKCEKNGFDHYFSLGEAIVMKFTQTLLRYMIMKSWEFCKNWSWWRHVTSHNVIFAFWAFLKKMQKSRYEPSHGAINSNFYKTLRITLSFI